MKKKVLYYIISLFLMATISFFGGILVAELKFRFQNSDQQSSIETEDTKKQEVVPTEEAKEKKEEQTTTLETVKTANEPLPSSLDSKNPSDVPAPSSKFSFAVIGDTQRFDSGNPNGGFQKAIKNITNKKVDLVMTEGDLVSGCGSSCEEKLKVWKNTLGSLASKTYESVGNHDRTGGISSDNAWQKVFNLPTNGPAGYSEMTYSFDFQNSHFVVLDSEKPEEHIINKTQRDWLENDLSSNKKENIFVFFHEPAFPVSSKIKESLDVEKKERDALWDILVRHKVTAVFNGHEHIHSRKKIGNIYQFVFGNTDSFDHDLPKAGLAEYSYRGRNFGIVEIEGKKITVNLYSVEGKLIDSFKFSN